MYCSIVKMALNFGYYCSLVKVAFIKYSIHQYLVTEKSPNVLNKNILKHVLKNYSTCT
jgi:hypothetical protein